MTELHLLLISYLTPLVKYVADDGDRYGLADYVGGHDLLSAQRRLQAAGLVDKRGYLTSEGGSMIRDMLAELSAA